MHNNFLPTFILVYPMVNGLSQLKLILKELFFKRMTVFHADTSASLATDALFLMRNDGPVPLCPLIIFETFKA